jgi:hypothetical protein
MRAKIVKRTCTLCGEKIELNVLEQAKHLYSKHPALFFKNIVQSVPRLQQLGITVTEAIQKGYRK